ncbi:MAG: sulfurtransferase TusA family protein [Bacteroidales bacterium]|nr:sulfurtransferase TusA family protein [Bacteroidales bacterium]
MATHILDITNEHCPMTFVKTKLKLAQIPEGDILEVLLTEGEPLNNLPRSAREQGYNILETKHIEGIIYKIVIQK